MYVAGGSLADVIASKTLDEGCIAVALREVLKGLKYVPIGKMLIYICIHMYIHMYMCVCVYFQVSRVNSCAISLPPSLTPPPPLFIYLHAQGKIHRDIKPLTLQPETPNITTLNP